jgi:hypothetical protein
MALLGAPGTALASTATASAATSAHAVHPDDTYTRMDSAPDYGRTVTLWLNDDTPDQWHAELTNGVPGDKVYLDYTNSVGNEPSGYSTASATIGSGSSLVNTSDHDAHFARACAVVVGNHIDCTQWKNIF